MPIWQHCQLRIDCEKLYCKRHSKQEWLSIKGKPPMSQIGHKSILNCLLKFVYGIQSDIGYGNQWHIQVFPEGVRQLQMGVRRLIIWPKNC